MAGHRLIVGLLVAAILPWTVAVASSAESATVTVTVRDAQTHRPVALATVTLTGPSALQGITGKDGLLRFGTVPPGVYDGSISRFRYQPTAIRSLIVTAGHDVAISATLSRLLHVITTVTTKSTARHHFGQASKDGGEALAAGSLGHALAMLSGVDAPVFSGGTQPLSLFGHAPQQSGIDVDGVPAAPPGTITDLATLGTDLFASVDVDQQESLSPGGAVDFHIPDPALAAVFGTVASYASYDSSRDSLYARGTSGQIGYSVGHATAGYDASYNGARFLDASGLTYPHEAWSLSQADVAKIRVPFAQTNVLNASWLSTRYVAPDACSMLTGALSCGYGPNTLSSQHLNSWQIKDVFVAGRVTGDITAFTSALGGEDDRQHAMYAGVPEPLLANYGASSFGAALDLGLFSHGNNHWSLSGLAYSTNTSGSAGTIDLVRSAFPNVRTSFGRVSLADALSLAHGIDARAEFGVNGTTGTGGSPYGSLTGTLQAGPRDQISVSADGGMLYPPVTQAEGLSQPSALAFDCSTRTAYGTAPGDSRAQASESTDLRASFDHQSRAAEVVVSAYQQTLHGAVIDGYAGGDAFPADEFPSGYLAQVDAEYSSPFGCGVAAPLAYADLALKQTIFGTARYRGVDVQAKAKLTPALFLQGHYDVTSATPVSSIAGSTIASGNQIVGVPLHAAGLLADWRSVSNTTEFAISAQFVGENSPGYQTSYSTVGAGARLRLRHGDVVLSVSNVFNTLSDRFGSTAIGETVGRFRSRPLRLIGLPLQPRTFQVSYRVSLGRSTSGLLPTASPDAGLPTSTTFRAAPLASLGGGDPFALNRDNAACGPESVGLVERVFSALRTYAGSAALVPYKSLPDGEYAYLRFAPHGGAALLIGGTRPAVEIALLSCAVVHAGTAMQAQALGLYAPTSGDKNFDMVFVPHRGFYITYDRAKAMQRVSAVRPYGGAPLSNASEAFALNGSASCTPELKGAAIYVLGELRSYVASPSPSALHGVTAVRHVSPKPWEEFHFDDAETLSAIEVCGTVFSVTAQQAAALGVGVTSPGTLDYAPGIGLYESDAQGR